MSWILHWLALASMAAVVPMASAYSLGSEQRFAMEPQDQTAVNGTRVTLPCRVTNKSGTLQWTKDGFGLGTHRSLPGWDRYAMVGSDEEGEFSLQIYPVILDDEDTYQCQVSAGPQNQPAGVRSRSARLTVLVAPEPPRIVKGSTLQATEDREVELKCVSAGGKPAAKITWIDGNGVVLTEGIEYSKELISDSGLYTACSVLNLTPKRKHHNMTFVCKAQNTADSTAQTSSIRVEVKYAPRVTVSVVNGAKSFRKIPEGNDVRIFCHADANPSELTYKWFLDDKQIQPGATSELVITNVKRSLHDADVKCQVSNALGKSEESKTLGITYGPRFRQRPSVVYADPGSSVTMACDVDGYPFPVVEWFRIDKSKIRDVEILGHSPNLTFIADEDRKGRYYCKASVDGFPAITAGAEVFLKGKPAIVSKRTQFVHSEEARVECEAISVPKHERVTWTRNGREITKYDDDYHFVEDLLPTGIKSILIIKNSQDRIEGIYYCSVTNSFGTDTIAIEIVLDKSVPMIIIISGVIGLIVIIALALTAIPIFLRKWKVKKPSACTPLVNDSHQAEKQCGDPDLSSNISNRKSELRTGSPFTGSETGSERGGRGDPLAQPVYLSLCTQNGCNGEHMCRYPTDYPDTTFLSESKCRKNVDDNKSYVSYVDYSRDLTPPLEISNIGRRVPLGNINPVGNSIWTRDGGIGLPNSRRPTSLLSALEPRYSAAPASGNTYRRSSTVCVLPTHRSPTPSSCPSTASTEPRDTATSPGPPLPSYIAVKTDAAAQAAQSSNSPFQYILSSQETDTLKRGMLATQV